MSSASVASAARAPRYFTPRRIQVRHRRLTGRKGVPHVAHHGTPLSCTGDEAADSRTAGGFYRLHKRVRHQAPTWGGRTGAHGARCTSRCGGKMTLHGTIEAPLRCLDDRPDGGTSRDRRAASCRSGNVRWPNDRPPHLGVVSRSDASISLPAHLLSMGRTCDVLTPPHIQEDDVSRGA